jgi:glycosyltransferase involved in cell wall biosynthesis
MENPLISVIVPVYKVEQYLRTCIDSVINQTYSNWELILVDDGSPDNSPRICDEYAAKDKRIKVFHKANGGVSSARNMALNNSKGEYITFLDGDDFLHAEYLAVLHNLSIKYEADITQCSFLRGTETVFPDIYKRIKVWTFDNHTIFLKGYSKIIVWGKLYKRKLLEGIRMPEGKPFEDDFTTWKWYYNANKIVVTDITLYYYTDNDLSTMSAHAKRPNLDFIEAYEERIDFFKKNGVKDLEDFSRGHLCKAMLLTSNNPKLSSEQKEIVDATFLANWKHIKFSHNIAFSLWILFFMYRLSPKSTLRLLNLVR